MKSTLLAILLCVALIIGFVWMVFGFGWLGVGYTKTVGVAQENANHEVFKAGKAYNEGMAKDLANYMLQYQQATTDSAKKGIVNLVVHTYADFDGSKLENADVRNFLNKCMNGDYLK
jgi:hypothetical protein